MVKEVLYRYPAIFTQDPEDPKIISVQFPDIYPGVTFGEGFDDAMYMAKDLLTLMLTTARKQCFPPSSEESIRKDFPTGDIVYVEVIILEDDGLEVC